MTDEQMLKVVGELKDGILERTAELIAKSDERTAELIAKSDERTDEHIEAMETKLLKEFRKWAVRIESRGRVTDALQIGYSERLSVVEQRLDDIEASK